MRAVNFVLFLLIDLFATHDFLFITQNWSGHRFVINILITTSAAFLFLETTLENVSPRKKLLSLIFLWGFPLWLQANYFSVYREFLKPFGVQFFWNNPTEVLQLSHDNWNWSVFFKISLAVLGFYFLSVRTHHKTQQSWRKFKLMATTFYFVSVTLLSTYAWYGVTEFQQSSVALGTTLVEYFSRKTGIFRAEKPSIDSLGVRHITPPAASHPNIIWVVGESANRNHMQIYGYPKPTTPCLNQLKEENRLVAFNNVTSVGNKTLLSVPYMLFGIEGPDPKGIIYKSPSIFNYAFAKGYKTSFFSAQDVRWYNLDKLIIDESVETVRPGPYFSPNVTISKGVDDGIVLEKGLLPYLKQTESPFFMAYQMDGSHYPYALHSPAAFKKFLPEIDPNDINSYDNTLVYTDHILCSLYHAVQKSHPNTWIFYSSDHGQKIDEPGQFNSGFSPQIIHNPFFVIPPQGRSVDDLKQNENSPVSQTDLFASTLDILNIQKELDGFSILKPISPSRVRISSSYMPTFENEPEAALITPEFEVFKVDFSRKQFRTLDDKVVKPLDELPTTLLRYLKNRLKKNNYTDVL